MSVKQEKETVEEKLRFILENAECWFKGIRGNLLAHRAGRKGDTVESSIGLCEYAEEEIRSALEGTEDGNG